jgi:hypothetical protein
MPENPQEFAELFGAKLVGELPDVGGGPFGMARLARLLYLGRGLNAKRRDADQEQEKVPSSGSAGKSKVAKRDGRQTKGIRRDNA